VTLLVITVRVVVILLVVRFILRLIWHARRPAAPQRRRPAERAGGTLVRDPNCGTHVPESRAITVGHGPSALHFCSTACRDAYAAAHRDARPFQSFHTP
jgi:hypothetical protein